MQQAGYYSHPTIHGETIVFVCEDDLWSWTSTGGARRLTAAVGPCSFPRLSPDGAHIGFIAREEGHPEVYVMPSGGGNARRLTFLGGGTCTNSGWSTDGREIIFASDANSPFERETAAYGVGIDGGAPRPLRLGHLRSLSMNGHGGVVVGRNNDDPARWKRYRGGTAGEIWIDASGEGHYRRLISLAGNIVWPMWVGDRIFFLSDHEGIGNIFSCEPDGSDLRRHTNETEFFARFPSTDGQRIVYTAGARVKLLDPRADAGSDGRPWVTALEIETPSTAPQTARRFVDASSELEEFAPSPNGESVGLIARGQPFTMPLFEEAVAQYGLGSKVRYRCLEWLRDGLRFAVVSDAPGYEQIEIHEFGAPANVTVVTSGEIGRVTELVVSPTAEIIAFANHRYELCLLDIESKEIRVVDRSSSSRVRDLAFSPDGRWLAYSSAVEGNVTSANPNASIIRVCKVKSGIVHDATSVMRVDTSPAWDPAGKYLYFISTRDFNPVYDALQFDLSFPQATRPFCVTLRRDVPSPFVPKAAPIYKDGESKDDKDESDKPVRIDIDFEGITGRILAFPVDEGDYGQIVAVKNRALFTRFPVRGIKPNPRSWDEEGEEGTLLAYDFEMQRLHTLHGNVAEIRLARDGRTLVYSSQERLRAIDALGDLPDDQEDDGKPTETGRKSGWIDLARVCVELDPKTEWAQMFREAWRLQREQFWTEDMSQVDWDLVFSRYAALLPRIRTRTELSDLMWEMQGELGTSHAYEIGGDYRQTPQYRRGFLGADLHYDADSEGYRISRIYRGDSWDRDADSPLSEPGLDINEGDVITAINGRTLDAATSPDELLVNRAAREVTLTLGTRKKDRRSVQVRALRDERALRYRAWVEGNRAFVHAQTGGRVGYVHIPDMGPWGFAEFHRGYLSEFDRDGLIVDVRYNRGGHVSPLLLEKLARKRVGYDVSRYGPPQPYPPESVNGPMVALTNQFAGSDGDIFSHCFKLYGLGPLIGKRTWGGVIGIDPYHRLVDGTITTQPEYSFWFTDVGWGVENYGTDPDYDIDIAPHDYRDRHDPQMAKAIELIESLRAARTNGKPHFHPRPSLRLPQELVSPG